MGPRLAGDQRVACLGVHFIRRALRRGRSACASQPSRHRRRCVHGRHRSCRARVQAHVPPGQLLQRVRNARGPGRAPGTGSRRQRDGGIEPPLAHEETWCARCAAHLRRPRRAAVLEWKKTRKIRFAQKRACAANAVARFLDETRGFRARSNTPAVVRRGSDLSRETRQNDDVTVCL